VIFHRAIVTLQLLKLASCGFAVADRDPTLAGPPINDPSAPNIGKICNIPPRFAVRNIRFVSFFVFNFVFIPMPIFVLAFIAAQTAVAAALSPRVEFLAIIRFRAF